MGLLFLVIFLVNNLSFSLLFSMEVGSSKPIENSRDSYKKITRRFTDKATGIRQDIPDHILNIDETEVFNACSFRELIQEATSMGNEFILACVKTKIQKSPTDKTLELIRHYYDAYAFLEYLERRKKIKDSITHKRKKTAKKDPLNLQRIKEIKFYKINNPGSERFYCIGTYEDYRDKRFSFMTCLFVNMPSDMSSRRLLVSRFFEGDLPNNLGSLSDIETTKMKKAGRLYLLCYKILRELKQKNEGLPNIVEEAISQIGKNITTIDADLKLIIHTKKLCDLVLDDNKYSHLISDTHSILTSLYEITRNNKKLFDDNKCSYLVPDIHLVLANLCASSSCPKRDLNKAKELYEKILESDVDDGFKLRVKLIHLPYLECQLQEVKKLFDNQQNFYYN